MEIRTMEARRNDARGSRRRERGSVPVSTLLASALLLLGACGSDAAPAKTAMPGPSVSTPANTPTAGVPPTTPTQPVGGMTATPPTMPTMPTTPTPPASMNMPPAAMNMPPAKPMDMTVPGSGMDMMPPTAKPPEPPADMGEPTLFWLEISSNRVFRANADGSNAKQFAAGAPLSAPDGVAVDPVDGHVFVLNMGSIAGGANNASLVRYKLDGTSPEVLIPPGTRVENAVFNTGKQVTLDRTNRKLYMADREGGKVWRCDLDGKNLEILVSAHGIMQIVGVNVDAAGGKFYFSDKPGHKIFRASIDMPAGKTHADREDVELLYHDTDVRFASSLDIELDLKARRLYWTDKDQNVVFGMGMDLPAGQEAATRSDVEQVVKNITGVIGLAFDHQSSVFYATHGGTVSSFKPDGSMLQRIGSNGSTGITFVRLP